MMKFKVRDTHLKSYFLKKLKHLSQIYPFKMTPWQKADAISRRDNFHVDFKNLIRFGLALWASSETHTHLWTGQNKKMTP